MHLPLTVMMQYTFFMLFGSFIFIVLFIIDLFCAFSVGCGKTVKTNRKEKEMGWDLEITTS